MSWKFLTNHGAILALISEHNEITVRELGAQTGITERSVLRIIADLEAAGYLERRRKGRSNWYEVNGDLPLRRTERQHVPVDRLLAAVKAASEDEQRSASKKAAPPQAAE